MDSQADDKPHVLVLGGLGFIGRNLVDYLVRNDLAREVVVADKVLPEMAWLSPEHKESFDRTTFHQINLIRQSSIANLFAGYENNKFDYVINCAGETKPWLPMKVYEDGVFTLSMNCAREAAQHGVKYFIEISSAELCSKDEFSPGSCSSTSLQKLNVEKELAGIDGLNFIIVRLPHVYGPGDVHGITPYLVFAGISKHLKEPLQMFWCSNHRYYTVNVHDVVRALFHLCLHGQQGNIYILVDDANTNQHLISEIVCRIFDLPKSYLGVIATNFIKMNQEEALSGITEKYLPPWTEMCSQEGIHSTPLYPHISEDLIHYKQYDLHGHQIPGFEYERPKLDEDLIMEVLKYYIKLNLFPKSVLIN